MEKVNNEIYLKNKSKFLLRLTNGNCSPPCSGGSGSRKLQSGYALCAIFFHHILPALVFAAQSPYSGWQNVSYLERYVKV